MEAVVWIGITAIIALALAIAMIRTGRRGSGVRASGIVRASKSGSYTASGADHSSSGWGGWGGGDHGGSSCGGGGGDGGGGSC